MTYDVSVPVAAANTAPIYASGGMQQQHHAVGLAAGVQPHGAALLPTSHMPANVNVQSVQMQRIQQQQVATNVSGYTPTGSGYLYSDQQLFQMQRHVIVTQASMAGAFQPIYTAPAPMTHQHVPYVPVAQHPSISTATVPTVHTGIGHAYGHQHAMTYSHTTPITMAAVVVSMPPLTWTATSSTTTTSHYQTALTTQSQLTEADKNFLTTTAPTSRISPIASMPQVADKCHLVTMSQR